MTSGPVCQWLATQTQWNRRAWKPQLPSGEKKPANAWCNTSKRTKLHWSNSLLHGFFVFPSFQHVYSPAGLTAKARRSWCCSLVSVLPGSARWLARWQVTRVVAVLKVQVFGLDINRAWSFCWEWFSVLTTQSVLLTLYSAVPAGACMHFHSYFIHTSLHFSVTNLYSCCRFPDPPLLGFINSLKSII